jgi:hypothetical protein
MRGWSAIRPRLRALLEACVVVLTVASPIQGQVRPGPPFVPVTLQAALGTPAAVTAAQAEVARASVVHLGWGVGGAGRGLQQGHLRVELGRDILPRGSQTARRDAAAAELERAAATFEGTTRRTDAVLIRAASRSLGWELIRRRRVAQDSLLMAAEEALRARFGPRSARRHPPRGGLVQVSRERAQRFLLVQANVTGRDLGGFARLAGGGRNCGGARRSRLSRS